MPHFNSLNLRTSPPTSSYDSTVLGGRNRTSMDPKEQRRNEPCWACGHRPPSDPAHIKTKGAGGPDALFNLMSLCRRCHTMQHKIGIKTFLNRHPHIRERLEEMFWEVEPKLYNPLLKK